MTEPPATRRITVLHIDTPLTPAPADADHRETLVARRADYLEQIDHLRSAAADLLDEAQQLDSPDEEELGDANGVNLERDRLLALLDATTRKLEGVDAALARLERGTYGRCERCGEHIAPERLAALPEATECVACKNGGLRLRSARALGERRRVATV